MADQSYQLLIKIVAELAQAKSSADELTRQIKIAKEAGQSYDALSKSLELVEQRMGQLEVAATKANQAMDAARFAAHPSQNEVANPRGDSSAEDAAQQKRIAGYKAELEARRELNAEKERYESSASQNTTANPRAGTAEEDAAQAARMAGYRAALQARKELSSQAAKEVADYTSLSGATREYILHLNQTNTETNKLTVSKGNLKAALKGLKDEFPGLGHFARLAMNPITATAAIIASGFALWRLRVKELNETYSSTELPDISAPTIGRVNQAAEAWKNLAKAVSDAKEKFNSVAEANDRSIKQINQTVELRKKELEAMKGLELAKLEQKKDDLEPEDYAAQKSEIEERYGRAGVAMSKQQEAALLERKSTRAHALGLEARDKLAEADKIKVGPKDQEDKLEADIKAQADAAREEIKKREERKNWITKVQDSGPAGRLAAVPRWNLRGYPKSGDFDKDMDDARAIEDQKIAEAKIPIEREKAFLKSKADRQRARDRKDELQKQAAADLAEKATIEAGLNDDVKSAKERTDSAARVEALKEETERTKAATDAAKDRKQRDEKAEREKNERGNKADQSVEKDFGKFRGPGSTPQASNAGDQNNFAQAFDASATMVEQAVKAALEQQAAVFNARLVQMGQNIADTNSRLGDSYNA